MDWEQKCCLSERGPGSSRLYLSSAALALAELGSVDRVLSLLGREGRSEREVHGQGARPLLASLERIQCCLSGWQGTPNHRDPAFQQFANESDMKGQLQISHNLDLRRSSIYFTWKKERRKEAEGLAG